MTQLRTEVLHPSSAETASGNSADLDAILSDGPGVVYVDVTAVSGTTPTLDFTVEEKDPTSGQYFTVPDGDYDLAPVQITATGVARYTLQNLFGSIYRLVWAIGGASPSFTFAATLQAKDRG